MSLTLCPYPLYLSYLVPGISEAKVEGCFIEKNPVCSHAGEKSSKSRNSWSLTKRNSQIIDGSRLPRSRSAMTLDSLTNAFGVSSSPTHGFISFRRWEGLQATCGWLWGSRVLSGRINEIFLVRRKTPLKSNHIGSFKVEMKVLSVLQVYRNVKITQN